ncbi:MAG: hypothetical protein ABIQ55_06950 [Gemmatimonadaceae bacterium]
MARFVVLGTLASDAYAGMAWMTMQVAVGLQRLGHDVYYFETTSDWPYDPVRQRKVRDSDYAVPYLARVAERFGFAGRWAYRRSYSDKAWFGIEAAKAEAILADADAVFNIAGATRLDQEGLKVRRLVLFGTDPVYRELSHVTGIGDTREVLAEHDDSVTYGENIGRVDCRIPALPNHRATTRQPVLMDLWDCGPPTRDEFTTIGNWLQRGREIEFEGELYEWSKHHEFLKFIDIPRRIAQPIELATNLTEADEYDAGGATVAAFSMPDNARGLLREHGWRVTDGSAISTDPWNYRDYIQSSSGEFTVARDLNIRLRSGWFSERSACYLAAGRPVVTQDTGFGTVLPTGEGLFAFNCPDDVVAAFDSIASDFIRHSRAAREIAYEFFRSEVVLRPLLQRLGL